MIAVKQAKNILIKNVSILPASSTTVVESIGFVLAENIYAPCDIPNFNQSAMDGFAVYRDSLLPHQGYFTFPITGELKAGDLPQTKFKKNSAMRIYTGAAVPLHTTGVVIQEKTTVHNGQVIFPVTALVEGSNIRLKGSHIKKQQLALSKGTLLNPAAIGLLCTLGIRKIKVINKPVITVLATGNELQYPGIKLQPGQIYESNSFTLKAAIKQTGFDSIKIKSTRDDNTQLLNNIQKMLDVSDVILITGGISVGKYDLVKDILYQLGVKELFYKVRQKPGKPLFAGKYSRHLPRNRSDMPDKIVLALPGNPAASLVCFYEYVLPVLRKMSGHSDLELKKDFLPITHTYELIGDRELFLKAKVENKKVSLLDGQESNMLKSFAMANALVYLPAGNKIIKKGTPVETHLLP